MLGRAGRREGARQRKERHFLAREKIVGFHRLRRAAFHLRQRRRRHPVAYLDCHEYSPVLRDPRCLYPMTNATQNAWLGTGFPVAPNAKNRAKLTQWTAPKRLRKRATRIFSKASS